MKELDQISNLLKQGGVDTLDLKVLINTYSDKAFATVMRIFNFVFEYRNEEYKPVKKDWAEEWLSMRILVAIVKEIARQNMMDWLLPFFTSRLKKLVNTLPEDLPITD